ncbi:MAG: STAS domain-containing protein [Methanoregula sp.]
MLHRTIPSATIVVLPERFDTSVAHGIEQELIGIAGENTGDLLCDFSGTRYISSAGLRVLFLIQKKMKAREARLAGFGLCPYVREVFEISGFYRVIPLYPTESDAVSDTGRLSGA